MSTLLARNPGCWAYLWSLILQHGYSTHGQYASSRFANDRDGSCQLAKLHCLSSHLVSLPRWMFWLWQEHKEGMSSLTCPFTALYPVLLCSWFSHLSLSRLLFPSRSMCILTSDYNQTIILSQVNDQVWRSSTMSQVFSSVLQAWAYHAVTTTLTLNPHSKPSHNWEPNLGYFPLCQLAIRNAHEDIAAAYC